jgi:hypothetical protein
MKKNESKLLCSTRIQERRLIPRQNKDGVDRRKTGEQA